MIMWNITFMTGLDTNFFWMVVRTMILPPEVPVSLYIDIWKWTACLWIRVIRRPNQVGFDKQTTFNVEPCMTNAISLLNFNSLTPEKCGSDYTFVYFQNSFCEILRTFCESGLSWSTAEPHWWQVNIRSGDGFLPPGNKPLSEPLLTHICVTIWHQ